MVLVNVYELPLNVTPLVSGVQTALGARLAVVSKMNEGAAAGHERTT
jgi:hypothetical protein